MEKTSKLPPVRVVTRVDYKEDGHGVPNELQNQVFVLNLATSNISKLTEGRFDHSALEWSPDGKTLAAIRRQRVELKSQLLLLGMDDGSERLIGHPDQVVRGFQWSPDGHTIAIAQLSYAEYSADLRLLDVASGDVRLLTEGIEWCPDYSSQLLAWTDKTRLIAAGFESGRSGLWSIDTVNRTFTRVLIEDTYRSGLVSIPGQSLVIQNRGSASETSELIVTDTTSGQSTSLTQLSNSNFGSHLPGSIEQHEVMNEGLSVSYLLKKPHNFDPRRTYPVVFEIHGGPHMFRGYDIETSNQLLLEAGYLVVCPNPRGSISWGLEYNGSLPDIHDMLVRQSLVTHMHKAVTPTLILHPEDDRQCPIGQGEQFFVGLMRAGVETEFVRYPGESHLMPWSGPAEYRFDFYSRILDWFEKHL